MYLLVAFVATYYQGKSVLVMHFFIVNKKQLVHFYFKPLKKIISNTKKTNIFTVDSAPQLKKTIKVTFQMLL